MTRLPAYAVAAVVLLRLLCGWHFFNEGVKKLEPTFTSAGFLRTAKGPLAATFKKMVPGPYGGYAVLTQPVEIGSRDAETRQAIDAWMADYGRRAAAAAKVGDPLPTDIDPAISWGEWIGKIRESWDGGLTRLGRLGVDGEVADRLVSLRDEKLGEIANYLHGENDAIEDLQHEAWRLERLKTKVGDSPAPFQIDLVAEQEGTVWKTIQPWVRSVQLIEEDFVADAGVIAAEAGVGTGRVASTLEERTLLSWTDFAVKCVVLGCGICVFLGLGTRIASILAAGFLLSLIMTQPPWVAGADLSAFFTWAIELAAFLVLAGIGAGQWAGLDGLLHQMRLRFGDLSPNFKSPPPRAASPAATSA